MRTHHKIQKISVLRGGMSDEYAVSLDTGAAVIEVLKKSPYTVEDIIITKQGEWLSNGIVRSPEHMLATTDVVFNALHGAYGEDGQVQRILDRLHIPYTGSGAYASSVAIHKSLTKNHVQPVSVKLAPHFKVTQEQIADVHRVSGKICEMFGPEYVVKPVRGGSSIGARMAHSLRTLAVALEDLLQTYDEVLVEQRITGKEATCGVVENFRDHNLYSLPVIEIVPSQKAQFFDYESKYDGTTDEICPGRFSKTEKAGLEAAARSVHQQLGLSQYSRSDFIVAEDGIYFLEVNTLPGLTKESLFPKALTAVGCPYDDFILHLVHDAYRERA